ncbi:hypothetical protein LEN26_016128 [Aphanomyces euteiches]|nr:hypothetical protein LEN26_016128 [Aphanomyces euteiches]KAH9108305.1 hypothetical protein AeMF1_016519 [Aphanomyces euteiches]KAH9109942.1 hypothetical protein AeMF1_015097 [Aphanomyces euteiches]KAH9110652.1 hypothetical protein AeMF1_014615 [Aphanomyces euteiches]KAH9114662.1 hypothetical protein AeMF1_011277 [Aphanomyces euteiches]
MSQSVKTSAKWTHELEVKLIALIKEVAAQPRLIASGGKNLRTAGWLQVLERFNGAGGITNIDQLQSKWRRLMADWSDFKFLTGLSGYGDEFDDSKWTELDEKPGKLKLSRFRHAPFEHFDTMGSIIGGTVATGEHITSASQSFAESNDSSAPSCSDGHGELIDYGR